MCSWLLCTVLCDGRTREWESRPSPDYNLIFNKFPHTRSCVLILCTNRSSLVVYSLIEKTWKISLILHAVKNKRPLCQVDFETNCGNRVDRTGGGGYGRRLLFFLLSLLKRWSGFYFTRNHTKLYQIIFIDANTKYSVLYISVSVWILNFTDITELNCNIIAVRSFRKSDHVIIGLFYYWCRCSRWLSLLN